MGRIRNNGREYNGEWWLVQQWYRVLTAVCWMCWNVGIEAREEDDLNAAWRMQWVVLFYSKRWDLSRHISFVVAGCSWFFFHWHPVIARPKLGRACSFTRQKSMFPLTFLQTTFSILYAGWGWSSTQAGCHLQLEAVCFAALLIGKEEWKHEYLNFMHIVQSVQIMQRIPLTCENSAILMVSLLPIRKSNCPSVTKQYPLSNHFWEPNRWNPHEST